MALHNAHGEFGWKRLSPNRALFYRDLLDVFISEPSLSFRCIVVDRSQLNHDRYNNGDAELGFYKLYYQMLVHWLQPKNIYHIYLDWQQNSTSKRFEDLRTVLIHKLSGRAKIACLEPVISASQPLIQLADVFMGAVGYQWNDRDNADGASLAKKQFIEQLNHALKRATLKQGTSIAEQKFNIFDWQGRV